MKKTTRYQHPYFLLFTSLVASPCFALSGFLTHSQNHVANGYHEYVVEKEHEHTALNHNYEPCRDRTWVETSFAPPSYPDIVYPKYNPLTRKAGETRTGKLCERNNLPLPIPIMD